MINLPNAISYILPPDKSGLLKTKSEVESISHHLTKSRTPSFSSLFAGHYIESNSDQILTDPVDVIHVLVLGCNRASVIDLLHQLIRHRPSKKGFPITVSLDCGHDATYSNVMKLRNDLHTVIKQPNLTEPVAPYIKKSFQGYYKVSRHYYFALSTLFDQIGAQQVIIVEDDLIPAVDFFSYFSATLPILRHDPSLYCVSAWNDNGLPQFIIPDPKLLGRTDFFPGLGWMMLRSLWKEFKPKWPQSFWDDWFRDPEQRLGRSCIRPEISRTGNIGIKGVSGSNSLIFQRFVAPVKINVEKVSWKEIDLSYLKKDLYDPVFIKNVSNARVTSALAALSLWKVRSDEHFSVQIVYPVTANDVSTLYKLLGLFDSPRSGMLRGAYRGVVSVLLNGTQVYLTPVYVNVRNFTEYHPIQ